MEGRAVSGDTNYLKVIVVCELLEPPTAVPEINWTVSDDVAGISDGKAISLTLASGVTINSANEICRYILKKVNSVMVGHTYEEEALIGQWLEWEATVLKNAVKVALSTGKLTEDLAGALEYLDQRIAANDGIIAHKEHEKTVSLAEIVIWSTLFVCLSPESPLYSIVHDKYGSLSSWMKYYDDRVVFSAVIQTASNKEGYKKFLQFIIEGNKIEHFGKKSGCTSTISSADIDTAVEYWESNLSTITKPRIREHPILPIPGEKNVLITSALPYVNNVPHLGNIIGCVLSGDVLSRYCRLRNYNTLYVCGTDEYGTATETKAFEEGLTPKQICDKYFDIQNKIYKWFNIDFDIFGRTSTPQQTQICHDIFWRLHERGFIEQKAMDQLLCQKCDRFLADRFVEGICPFCSYPDARGDQCDKCGKLINATELKSPRCKICSGQPQVMSSDHLFLDLSKLQPTVLKWSQESSKKGIWSQNAKVITSTWIRDGLKPRCITRDLKWGTPVPLEGYTNKVFYVWFDAPIGYISITACYTEKWEKWWKNPKEVELYQFMAKDNIPFHTVVFPSTLIGTDNNYTLLNHISSTEYLNYEDDKFSKSRKVGVFGDDARDTDIPADIYRFYLLYVRPETQDTAFNWSDFALKVNTELLNNVGNFVNRVLVFIKNNFAQTIPATTSLTPEDATILARVNQELKEYNNCLETQKIRDGLKHILNISRLGNGYLQASKPWTLVKGTAVEKAQAGSVLSVCTNVVCLLSVMIQPYMPLVGKEIQAQLQAPDDCNVLLDNLVQFIQPGHKIGEPKPLFSKLDDEKIEQLKKRFSGQGVNMKSTTTKINGEQKKS